MTSPSIFRVLIIGGGSCGLALAHGLKKAGIDYTIFERDSADEYWSKPRDWGMQLHWGKDFLFKNVPEDLQARFSETSVDPGYQDNEPIPHINGVTGQVLARTAMPDMVRVSRKKMRTWLTSNQDLQLSFKKRLLTVTSTGSVVTATFEDGSTEQGHLIIGADGSRSKVREFLVGVDAARPTDTGMTMINTAVKGCYTADQARLLRTLHPITKCAYDPDVHGIFIVMALDTPDPNHPETWAFQTQHAWWGAPKVNDLQDPRARLEFYKSRFSKLCEPFRTAVCAMSDDTVLPIDPCQQWSPILWDNRHGTVTLAGDAAHSMLPNRGQGLNNAMQDAAEIVDAVKSLVAGHDTLQAAITAYEDGMRPRGFRDVALSLDAAVKTLVTTNLSESPMFRFGLQKMNGEKHVVAVENAVLLG